MRKLVLVLAALVAVLIVAVVAAVVLIDPDDYREEIAERASQQLGREVSLDGPMALKLFPWLALEISDVGVGNPPGFGAAPALAHVGTAVASIRVWPLLRGDLEIGAVTLEDAEIALVTNSRGQSNLDGLMAADPDRPESETDLSRLALGQLRLRNVNLVQLDQRSQQRTILSIDRFDLEPFRVEQPIAFGLSARLSDGTTEQLRLNTVSGTIQVARDAARVDLARLIAEFELPDAAVSGSLRGAAGVDLGAAVTTVEMPVLDLTLLVDGLRVGLNAQAPVSVVLGDPVTASFDDARLSLNEQVLNARGQVRLGDPLRAELAVSGERLDLRPFMATTQPARGRGSEPAAADFEVLHQLAVQFDLALDTLLLSDQLTLTGVEAQARLDQGLLTLEPMRARLFGGGFDGRVAVDFNDEPPSVVLQPRLSGIAVDQLTRLSGAPAPVRGLGNLNLDLRFSGFDLADILASLDGHGDYSIEDGALMGVDLRRLINEELTTANLQNVSKAFGGATEFERFSGQMIARSGIIELPNLNMVASDFGLSGTGNIDLPGNRVDYRVNLALGEALTARLPRALRDATGGRVPLTIAGPLGEPRVSMDVAGLAERALRQQIEQRLTRPRSRDEQPDDQTGEQLDAPREGEQEQTEEDQQAEPERRERSRDVLMRTLLERREREEERDEEEEAEPEPEPPVDP